MSFDSDDEILQDFMVEAGEILELLNEQLVELEQSPDDTDLLNAVFRGFHTIKGGAGFLALTPLVDVCHRAEDVFNLLRNGERAVTAKLMDIMLPVLDVLNSQFDSLRSGDELEDADKSLLLALEKVIAGDDVEEDNKSEAPNPELAPSVEEVTAVDATASPAVDDKKSQEAVDITDEEFETLLTALDSSPQASESAEEAGMKSKPESSSDEITEDEFDALLDDLHGKGRHGGLLGVENKTQGKTKLSNDEITEDEFETLLDDLHGKGKHSGSPIADKNSVQSKLVTKASEDKKKTHQKPEKAPAESKVAKGTDKKTEVHQAEPTVRVDTRRLDDIMNMVGELVLVRNRISTLFTGDNRTDNTEEVSKAVANLDLVTGDLQMAVMKTRMQPIKKVFGRFPRVVRDLARTLNKEVKLEITGEDTDLDKNLVEALADPLVHLVRNAVDHGVETPDVREAAGKSRAGTLKLIAEQEGDHILLIIEDDGAGMDANVLRNKAIEKGMLDKEAAERLDDKDCFALIFAAGFSTKENISDVSGRGVGMDVVKTRIAQLNGTVEIDSAIGTGTRLVVKLPLTLAIMPTLMIKLQNQNFALPLVNVNEIFHLDLTRTNVVDGQRVIVIREKSIPLYYLSRWLVKEAANDELPESGHVVMVNSGVTKVGFIVDELLGQEEVVIKPLGAMLAGTSGLAGATITGDGRIAIIVDIPGLMGAYAATR